MKINKGDYLVIEYERKMHLTKALAPAHKDSVEVVLEKLCHIPNQRYTTTVELKDLVLNLGSEPKPGKVYGLDVTNLFCGRKLHEDFGLINFFYRPSKQVVKDLWAAFNKVAKILNKRGLSFLLDDLIWEILPYTNEAYAGMYLRSNKEGNSPRIQIRPEIMPASEYVYVILHELAHHLHLGFATGKKLNASWLRLFNTSIRVVNIKKETSSSLLDALLAQEDVPSAFRGQLEEEDALAFKWVLRTISQINALSIKELDILFEADAKDDIRKIWPVRNIHRKDLAPVISEYATKNYRETIAEAVSFVMVGKKLPEPIVKLVEKTISYAKTNREK